MPRRERPEMLVIERASGGSSLWWFLIGGALGAGLALLFAPQSGDRTRRLVGQKLSKLRDAADVALEDLREALTPEERVHRSLAENEGAEEEEYVRESVEVAEEAEGRTVRKRSPRRGGGRGAASARHELEQRLAEARARRQRAVADEDEEPVA